MNNTELQTAKKRIETLTAMREAWVDSADDERDDDCDIAADAFDTCPLGRELLALKITTNAELEPNEHILRCRAELENKTL